MNPVSEKNTPVNVTPPVKIRRQNDIIINGKIHSISKESLTKKQEESDKK